MFLQLMIDQLDLPAVRRDFPIATTNRTPLTFVVRR
jgi:hypothetical protein